MPFVRWGSFVGIVFDDDFDIVVREGITKRPGRGSDDVDSDDAFLAKVRRDEFSCSFLEASLLVMNGVGG